MNQKGVAPFFLKALIKSNTITSHVIPLCGSLFTCSCRDIVRSQEPLCPPAAECPAGYPPCPLRGLRGHLRAPVRPQIRSISLGPRRLERITEAVKDVRCGDYRLGAARLKCSNPSRGCEMFRPFSCRTFYLCPSCSQKRTLLFAEFLSENLLLRSAAMIRTFHEMYPRVQLLFAHDEGHL